MKTLHYVGSFAMAMCMTACVNEDLYRPAEPEPLKPISQYFDFNTTQKVQCNINYGTLAAGSLVEVYSSNPLENENGPVMLPTRAADFSVHLDSKGQFTGNVELPSDIKEMYIYSSSYAAPELMKVAIESGKAVAKTETFETRSTRTASGEKQVYSLGNNIYSLFSSQDEFGNVKNYDSNGLLSTGSLIPQFYSSLQYMLWGGKTSKPGGLNNRQYAVGSDVINTSLLARGINPATGQDEDIESINLYFTFVGEAAWNENAIGYYYYDTANPPSSSNDVKKIVILPNCSLPNHVPYGLKGNYMAAENQGAPAKSNMQVQLLYVDKDGKASVNFPPGITIGYFLIANAYGAGTSHRTEPAWTTTTYYSNEAWNNNNEKRYIALEANDGSILYGVEDSTGDFSADDVLWTISSSPNFAMNKPAELPKIDVDMNEKITYTTQNTMRTYAFEDIWPTGGDYDLNDVIIEHTRSITFNQKNYVSEVTDEFKAVHPKGSADYTDAFGVQINPNYRENITLPEGAVDETETSSILVFTNARNQSGQTKTITRKFGNSLSSGVLKSVIEAENLNPYIISQYEAGSKSRTEVHMPKAQATKYADSSLATTKDDAYYINRDGKHPFAITLPTLNWKPAAEKQSISKAYPKFDNWVATDGNSDTDWYK